VIINQANLQDLFKAYNVAFKQGLGNAKPLWPSIATQVPSSTKENHYAWLGQFPKLREWLGDRVVKSMEAYDYSIKNKKFESTVGVPRDDIEDDTYGVYTPLMKEMGVAAAMHPDELVWALLAAGITTPCYDGQYFFDTDHPVAGASVANVDSGGANNYWFLTDMSHEIKPILLQMRRDYAFRAINNLNDSQVFDSDVFKFGVDARLNVGFGFWQQAYASNQALDGTHFDAAWQAMSQFKGDQGHLLGIRPTHLVVGASNRAAALATIEVERLANGASNPNYKTVEVVVSPYLA
jgi:phage major head subunit gpT-like protein